MSIPNARASLTIARQVYLTALRRACVVGTPVEELRGDIAATQSASEQLVSLTVAQRLTPAPNQPALGHRSLADATR